jgi:hypothetical protein
VVSETNLKQFREVTPAGRYNATELLDAQGQAEWRLDPGQGRLDGRLPGRGPLRVPERGPGALLQEGLTGEGVKLMTAASTGDLFLAHDKRKIMILDLENERMTVNGDNDLAIEQGIDRDIHRVEGAGRLSGGLFNVVLQGSGKVLTGLRSDVSFKTFTSRGPGSRSRCPSKAPAVSSYSPRKARLSPAFPRERGRRWRRDRRAPQQRLALQHLSRSASRGGSSLPSLGQPLVETPLPRAVPQGATWAGSTAGS